MNHNNPNPPQPELLPCPFCGSHAHVRDVRIPPDSSLRAYWVECVICEVGTKYHDSIQGCAQTWNTRTVQAAGVEAPLDDDWCDDCHGYTHTKDCPSSRIASKASIVEKVVDAVYRSMSQYDDETWFLDNLKAQARVRKLLRANATAAGSGGVNDGYEMEMQIGKDWVQHKRQAERIVNRIADNDCLTCKHWGSDAVHAIAVELAAASRGKGEEKDG